MHEGKIIIFERFQCSLYKLLPKSECRFYLGGMTLNGSVTEFHKIGTKFLESVKICYAIGYFTLVFQKPCSLARYLYSVVHFDVSMEIYRSEFPPGYVGHTR